MPIKIPKSLIVIALLGVSALYRPGLAQAPATNLPAAQDIISYLNQSIDWHRQSALEEQVATDTSDILFLNDDRQTARQLLKLSFDFARADAQLLTSHVVPQADVNPAGAEGSGYQSLVQTTKATDDEVRQTQAELESDKAKLAITRGADRQKLQATVDELQSELDLAQTRSKTLHDILQFVSGASGSGGSLTAQIDQLQHSVPELEADNTKGATNQPNTASPASPAATPAPRRNAPSGLLGLIEDLFSISHKVHVLEQRAELTDQLMQSSQKLRAPLIANLTTIAQQGEQAAKEADTSDTTQLEQLKQRLNNLTGDFKDASAVVLPLSKQAVLFTLYKSNLSRWREVVKNEYRADLRRLFLRTLIFAGVLILVIILAEVWRRAVFRYVHDARRRYQFLLLRRIVLWFVVGITIAFALATEIGSIATFAGLITAGIAVALQNVILAIAGYFFLIGKYGVRVGDRVQISGVTGDVVDIGLIRLHLMEVGNAGSDRQPTGRIVVFSNSVVFQPTASFYKQIPGTNFVWHEVSLTLAPESDYTLAEKQMMEAVERVYAEYRDRIESQYREMERTLSVVMAVPRPRSRLRLTQNGLEVLIRYPAEVQDAAEVDDRITRELLRALERNPKLKLVGSGIPNIQPVTEDTQAA